MTNTTSTETTALSSNVLNHPPTSDTTQSDGTDANMTETKSPLTDEEREAVVAISPPVNHNPTIDTASTESTALSSNILMHPPTSDKTQSDGTDANMRETKSPLTDEERHVVLKAVNIAGPVSSKFEYWNLVLKMANLETHHDWKQLRSFWNSYNRIQFSTPEEENIFTKRMAEFADNKGFVDAIMLRSTYYKHVGLDKIASTISYIKEKLGRKTFLEYQQLLSTSGTTKSNKQRKRQPLSEAERATVIKC
ncbi:hypothetical protein HDU76_009442, partial [Blyttiomyces sp. JEL0837]